MAPKRRDVAAAAAAAVAWVCAADWSPALRWAGYAFVAGFAAAAAGLTAALLLTSRRPGRPALAPGTGRAAFLEPRRWRAEVDALRRRQAYGESDRPALGVEPSARVSQAVDALLGLVLRDFVRAWYAHISRGPSFPDQVDRAARLALANLLGPLARQDLAAVVTGRLVPILTAHFRGFADAERSVRGRKLNRSVTESEELDLAIAAKFRDGRLHPAASLSFPDAKMVQQDYLRSLVARVLPCALPADELSSRAVSILVRELVACAVLWPLLQLLSDPDTWNQLIESYGRPMLQDRSTVRLLRAALDQHASPAQPPRSSTRPAAAAAAAPRLAPGDGERKFEKFIRAIRKVNNLSDARRFRSEVASQLKRDSSQLDDSCDPVYLRRLEMGKRLLDQRVSHLAAAAAGDRRAAPARPQPLASSASSTTSRLENASLVELLRDSSGLSYFMEYMDRQRLMPLVQFWLVVDGIRNPLEDDEPDEEEREQQGEQGQGEDYGSSNLPVWTESDRMDLLQIHQAYLSRPELNVRESSKREVRRFLQAGSSATPAQYHRARRSILKAQSGVLNEMQSRYFHNFKKSDLYYKCLASQESSGASLPSAAASSQQHPPLQQAAQSYQSRPKPINRLAPSDAQRSDSTSDLRALDGNVNGPDSLAASHRSLDESSPSPLFDDDLEHDGMLDSVHSFDQDGAAPQHQQVPDTRVVQAVEQALNIMDDKRLQTAEDLRAALFGAADDNEDSIFLSGPDDSNRGSIDAGSRPGAGSGKEAEKPSLSSLGLVSAASRIGVFVDDDLFDYDDKYLPDEDDEDKGGGGTGTNDDEVLEAAPGDLGLAEAIAALTADIDRLAAQEAVVESLTKKAELTNNTSELRILRKSKASLQREMRRKELQRRQYVVQESDNSLYGRSTIRIKSIQVGKDDGREFALYVVEVQRDAGEQMPAASWIVTKRYSEFHDLHQRLRSRYPSVRNLDFPRRRVVMKFQSEFLRRRRTALETYLRELLLLPDVCRSRELRAFLSQSAILAQQQQQQEQGGGHNAEDKKDMTRLYDSVTDGMDDILGNIPVLDQISVAGQNLISAATSQLHSAPLGDGTGTGTGSGSNEGAGDFPAAEAEAELDAFENKEGEPFIKPICDIFLEVFELNRGNNWLRGRAVVMVLQQLLGGTIERKVRDNVRMLVQEESILRCLGMVTDSLWPGGELLRDRKPRGAAERDKTRAEASLMLATLVPDLVGSVVGRVNAQAASRRIFATLNNARLNAHLAFTMLDEIVSVVFDEA